MEANQNGTITRTFGNYPFGETWYETGTGSKRKFTSYERDGESGLDYAMFRYDSTNLGRFMSPDPLAGNIANPESLNRYTYVLNDPVNLIDPLGLRRECRTQYTWVVESVWVEDPADDRSAAGGHWEYRPRLVETENCHWVPDEKGPPSVGGGGDDAKGKLTEQQRLAAFEECVSEAEKSVAHDMANANAEIVAGGAGILLMVGVSKAMAEAEVGGGPVAAGAQHEAANRVLASAAAPLLLFLNGLADKGEVLSTLDRLKAACQARYGVFPVPSGGHK